MKSYGNWRLHSREEKTEQTIDLFYERWVDENTKSGIVFYTQTPKAGEVVFVVEGYGLGTINPETFKEISKIAPIQRSVHKTEEEGRRALFELQKENNPE